MADKKATLLKLNENLNILKERKAKFAGNAPLDLLNQIKGYEQAIDLTRQVITGEISEQEWQEAQKSLLLAMNNGQVVNIEAETYVAADVKGDIVAGDKVVGDKVLGDKIITVTYEAPPPPLPPAEAQERRNLGILLKKVKTFWIEGVLEKSIHQVALIDLGKETQAEAVSHAWEQVLELPDQSRQTLPPNKKISQIFDELNRAMLILGEPGSGKTITLLQLAQDLIDQAEADETFSQPVPVVFNLSSWKDKGQPLIDWMVTELITKYQIPKRIGRPWLKNNRILPLLDGLDEVKPENQAACVEEINKFGEEFGLAGLVVCSRFREYSSLPTRLKLNGAIRLQPLTLEQIYEYLDAAGSKLDVLRMALQTDEDLQEMTQSPLILGIMSLAYQDMPFEVLSSQATHTIETRRKHLFDTYIERMFRRKGAGDKPYNDDQTKGWLSWLARQMTEHNHDLFLIELLQPSWLSNRSWLWGYVLGSRVIEGTIVGVCFGLFLGLGPLFALKLEQYLEVPPINALWLGLLFGLIVGLTIGPILGLIVGVFAGIKFERNSDNSKAKRATRRQLTVKGLVLGLTLMLVGGFIYKLIFDVLPQELDVGNLGAILGLGFALFFGLTDSKRGITDDIKTTEALGLSSVRGLTGGGVGLILGFIYALVIGLIMERGPGSLEPDFLDFALVFALLGGVITAILWGLRSKVVETKTNPNEGIRLSSGNAVFTGVIIGPILAVLGGVSTALLVNLIPNMMRHSLIWGLAGGLVFGVCGAALTAYLYGGRDVIQHFILRYILSRQDSTTFNYAHFLDYATELIFLQKVGGGYIFIHRLLLEHFSTIDEVREDKN